MSDSEEAERSVAILAALTDAMLRLARRGENRESLPGWRDLSSESIGDVRR